jgi:disulfide bond formation protein DsbB
MCESLKKIPPRFMLILLVLITLVILGMAYILKNYFGFQPCQLCLYEQKVFMAAGALSFVSILLPSRLQYYAILLVGLVFFGGAGLAAYHVAVQQHWVDLPAFCTSQDFSAFDSVEALKEQMLNTPLVRCDQVTWSFLGLSLAAYNTVLSLFLGLFCWKWACKNR